MKIKEQLYDVIILGAGAAGMLCAIECGKRGRKVLLIDHASHPGEKIRISGGGKCNFTNTECVADRFISNNPHFMKSALSRYTPYNFIELIETYKIGWHEKKLGQLFCHESAQQIVDMLRAEMLSSGVDLQLRTGVERIEKQQAGYQVTTRLVDKKRKSIARQEPRLWRCDALVVATGGKSIPKMGATGFGYKVAEQFGLQLVDQRPGLVPLTFHPALKKKMAVLAGVSAPVHVCLTKEGHFSRSVQSFEEDMLFTHRGLSGPAVLQISSYWQEGQAIRIGWMHGIDLDEILRTARAEQPKKNIVHMFSSCLPGRLAEFRILEALNKKAVPLAGELSNKAIAKIETAIQGWDVTPTGTEGYRTAEVTVGGVDTRELSSRTMEANKHPGLYFIGEVVDVTGWLGGYNFQWAWSSGWAAGQVA